VWGRGRHWSALMTGAWPDARFSRNMKDAENRKIVFEVYAGHPMAALILAQQLTEIRQGLERRRKGEAIKSLDLAIDPLTH
jgi:hypothetical protein